MFTNDPDASLDSTGAVSDHIQFKSLVAAQLGNASQAGVKVSCVLKVP